MVGASVVHKNNMNAGESRRDGTQAGVQSLSILGGNVVLARAQGDDGQQGGDQSTVEYTAYSTVPQVQYCSAKNNLCS